MSDQKHDIEPREYPLAWYDQAPVPDEAITLHHTAPFDRDATSRVMQDVISERKSQHDTWGVQRHSWPEWISILTEEVGEAAERANQAHWPPPRMTDEVRTIALDELRRELIQVAAVAVSILEHIEEVRTTGTR